MPWKSGDHGDVPETDSTMNSHLYTEMGFDDWRELASDDPDAFEVTRSAVIEELLASAPDHSRERLRGLQWRIDTIREHSSNPMAACLDIYAMMWDKLAGENGMLDTIQALDKPYLRHKARPSAQILDFQPRSTRPE